MLAEFAFEGCRDLGRETEALALLEMVTEEKKQEELRKVRQLAYALEEFRQRGVREELEEWSWRLAQWKSRGAVRHLLKELSQERNTLERCLIIRSLGRMGMARVRWSGKTVVQWLEKNLLEIKISRRSQETGELARALAQLKSTFSLPILRSVLANKGLSEEARPVVERAIKRLGAHK